VVGRWIWIETDELLDALGRGGLPVEDDEVAVMLAAGAGMLTDQGAHERARTPVAHRGAASVYHAKPRADVAGRRRWSRRQRLAIAAAVVAIAGGGTRGRRGAIKAGESIVPVTPPRFFSTPSGRPCRGRGHPRAGTPSCERGRRDDARRPPRQGRTRLICAGGRSR